jgi:hypothetical protein
MALILLLLGPRRSLRMRTLWAVHVKNAIVELDGLMRAVVRFVCIPDGSDPRVPKVPS